MKSYLRTMLACCLIFFFIVYGMEFNSDKMDTDNKIVIHIFEYHQKNFGHKLQPLRITNCFQINNNIPETRKHKLPHTDQHKIDEFG